MRRKLKAGIAALAVVAAMAGAAPAQEAPQPRLVVEATGRAAAVPDMATVTLGAQAEDTTAKAAMDAVSVVVAGLLERLAAAGVAPRDVQTTGLTLNPVWDHGRDGQSAPRISGFAASNTVTVRVRDLVGLGVLLDAMLEGGATTFQGLSFGLSEPGPVEDAARRDAVAAARAQAEVLAEAAGVTLGPILRIETAPEGGGPVPMMRMDAMMASEAVPIAEGEVETLRRVRIEWALGNEGGTP